MNAQKFNQRCHVGTVFGLRTFTGLHFVRTVAPAHDIGNGQAMVEINRNPWFVPIKALHSVAPESLREPLSFGLMSSHDRCVPLYCSE
ncbi:Uncharacterised protein [Leminorella richardii]|uniref:Uncharacterized protein n=1 Tax=Leminorella richardii TaxID=158841 RepID=A0A2X4X610_9GAMM|nr:Uncharacterised protein [Leminorella richardii]